MAGAETGRPALGEASGIGYDRCDAGPGNRVLAGPISRLFIVLRSIVMIFKDHRPLLFFSIFSALLLLITLVAGLAPILDYLRARYVIHVPLAIVATGTGILGALSLTIGLILHTISRYHDETFDLLRRLYT